MRLVRVFVELCCVDSNICRTRNAYPAYCPVYQFTEPLVSMQPHTQATYVDTNSVRALNSPCIERRLCFGNCKPTAEVGRGGRILIRQYVFTSPMYLIYSIAYGNFSAVQMHSSSIISSHILDF